MKFNNLFLQRKMFSWYKYLAVYVSTTNVLTADDQKKVGESHANKF